MTTTDLAWIMDDLDDVDEIDDSRVCVIIKRMRRTRRFFWATAY